MRLIDTETLQVCDLSDARISSPYVIPPYAILSHTWGDAEVTFQDMQSGNIYDAEGQFRTGYMKIKKVCELAVQEHRLPYVWVDTCCIDKTSSSELSEAINSMFRWYQDSVVCYAYLSDIALTSAADLSDLKNRQLDRPSSFDTCRWFERGWTLQELIAPGSVSFYDRDWHCLGDKLDLAARLSGITGIDVEILRGGDLHTISIARRMSWASKRRTKREEDMAYCLLGIFEINMPLLYGEGPRAFTRLQKEIIQASSDHSIFAWDIPGQPGASLAVPILASAPSSFGNFSSVVPCRSDEVDESFAMTNVGIRVTLPLMHRIFTINNKERPGAIALLNCTKKNELRGRIALPLLQVGPREYCRCMDAGPVAMDWRAWRTSEVKTVYILQDPSSHKHRRRRPSVFYLNMMSFRNANFQFKECYPPAAFDASDGLLWLDRSVNGQRRCALRLQRAEAEDVIVILEDRTFSPAGYSPVNGSTPFAGRAFLKPRNTSLGDVYRETNSSDLQNDALIELPLPYRRVAIELSRTEFMGLAITAVSCKEQQRTSFGQH